MTHRKIILTMMVIFTIGLVIWDWCSLNLESFKTSENSHDPIIMVRSEKAARIHSMAKAMDPKQSFWGFFKKDESYTPVPETPEEKKRWKAKNDFADRTVNILNLCKEGNKDKVLAMGQESLSKNPDDVTGLILLFFYYRDSVEVDLALDTGIRLLETANRITIPHLQRIRPRLARAVDKTCKVFSRLSPTEIRSLQNDYGFMKTTISGVEFLIALEEDDLL